jgi:hypothetical protein
VLIAIEPFENSLAVAILARSTTKEKEKPTPRTSTEFFPSTLKTTTNQDKTTNRKQRKGSGTKETKTDFVEKARRTHKSTKTKNQQRPLDSEETRTIETQSRPFDNRDNTSTSLIQQPWGSQIESSQDLNLTQKSITSPNNKPLTAAFLFSR